MSAKSQRVLVTLPRPLLDRLQQVADELGLPLSEFMFQAALRGLPALVELVDAFRSIGGKSKPASLDRRTKPVTGGTVQ